MACLISLGPNPDDKTGSWMPIMYQVIEAPIGIICVSVPNLPPVLEQLLRSRFGTKIKSAFSRSKSGQSTKIDSIGHEASGFTSMKTNSPKMSSQSVDLAWVVEGDEVPLRDIEIGWPAKSQITCS
jgi:hypothetical protein